MHELESSLFKMKPLGDEEFSMFLESFGFIAPAVLTRKQLVDVLATVLQNYTDPEDEATLRWIANAAVGTVLDVEMALALDTAVGPEDGVN